MSKPEKYLEYLAEEVKKLQETPGRKMMNLEDSSFNAWVKHYRPDENSVNTAVSYYQKGELVGLLLDLEIPGMGFRPSVPRLSQEAPSGAWRPGVTRNGS